MVRDILALMRVGARENKGRQVFSLHEFAQVGQSLVNDIHMQLFKQRILLHVPCQGTGAKDVALAFFQDGNENTCAVFDVGEYMFFE